MDVISLIVAALILFATKSVEQISSEVGGAAGRHLGSLFGALREKLSHKDDRALAAAVRSLESGRVEPTQVAHLVSVLRRLERSDRQIKNILQDLRMELDALPEVLRIQHASLVDQVRSIIESGDPGAGAARRGDDSGATDGSDAVQRQSGVIQVSNNDIPSQLIDLLRQLPIGLSEEICGRARELLMVAQQSNAVVGSKRTAGAIVEAAKAVEVIGGIVSDLKQAQEKAIIAVQQIME